MAHAVNIAENIERLEEYPADIIDSARTAPGIVCALLKNRMQHELKVLLETTMEAERDQQIQALRYERGVIERQDYRNGYRKRNLGTTYGTVELRVPRGRQALDFSVFEIYRRRWHDLDSLLLESHIGGLSCRVAGERIAGILGSKCSATTVAGLKKQFEQQLQSFKNAPLKDDYVALVIDGMFLRIRQCGSTKRPVVAVLGILPEGEVQLLNIRVCYSENSTEVEGMLRNVKERGVHGVNLKVITMDGDKGLEAAALAVYGNVRIQDCVFHKINRLHANAVGKKRGRRMMQEASAAFEDKNPRSCRRKIRRFCEKWRDSEPQSIACFEKRLERCFEVNALPSELRSKAATTGLCENLFKQLRCRIKRIGAFETPSAVELFVFAIVCQKKWIGIPGRSNGAPLLDSFTHFS